MIGASIMEDFPLWLQGNRGSLAASEALIFSDPSATSNWIQG